MTEDEQDEIREKAYIEGRRSAMASIVSTALRDLGYEGRSLESMVIEREAAIAALREVCRDHGDNDWPDDLHLADIIEKHLGY